MLSFVVAPKVKFAVDGEETGADGTIIRNGLDG